jgi:hypothetical protein
MRIIVIREDRDIPMKIRGNFSRGNCESDFCSQDFLVPLLASATAFLAQRKFFIT